MCVRTINFEDLIKDFAIKKDVGEIFTNLNKVRVLKKK